MAVPFAVALVELVGFVELLAGIEGPSVLHCPVEDVGADAIEGEGGFLTREVFFHEEAEGGGGVSEGDGGIHFCRTFRGQDGYSRLILSIQRRTTFS